MHKQTFQTSPNPKLKSLHFIHWVDSGNGFSNFFQKEEEEEEKEKEKEKEEEDE